MHLPPSIADQASARHGIVTAAALAGHGFTARQIRGLRDHGVLVPVHAGVYRIRSNPATFHSNAVAACAARESIYLAGVSAGKLWEYRKLPRQAPTAPIIALSSVPGQIRLAGVKVHRTTHLPPGDLVVRPDGIRLTSPVRTALDLAAVLGDEEFESVIEQVLERRICTFATILAARRRWVAPGRPGVRRVNRVLGSRAASVVPVHSDLELQVARGLRRRGIDLVRQHPILLPNGITVHADLCDPDIAWIVEIDHFTWHGGRQATRRDKERDRQLHLLGWLVERVEDEALVTDPEAVLDELCALHAVRAAQFPVAGLSHLRRNGP